MLSKTIISYFFNVNFNENSNIDKKKLSDFILKEKKVFSNYKYYNIDDSTEFHIFSDKKGNCTYLLTSFSMKVTIENTTLSIDRFEKEIKEWYNKLKFFIVDTEGIDYEIGTSIQLIFDKKVKLFITDNQVIEEILSIFNKNLSSINFNIYVNEDKYNLILSIEPESFNELTNTKEVKLKINIQEPLDIKEVISTHRLLFEKVDVIINKVFKGL
ncbi:hypothetical protein [Candidatus Contubernalis alkaliaceticus]|uniref:hypothetical protein n=1 Tax=Candidatus Contubernalis alkaliaceticus TaxID=338645 RepID=UPI001F4C4524|nr:hypothetical protein [Candidatus Contubernalis alkalaceticus]UNC93543.1 hypothetical protein HUE98_16545 [Candidatus Contubernalis alkalaceticus]